MLSYILTVGQAISWAVDVCHVDVINLLVSFNWADRIIEEAVGKAIANGVLVFAPTSIRLQPNTTRILVFLAKELNRCGSSIITTDPRCAFRGRP
jgi:hypothetical protein